MQSTLAGEVRFYDVERGTRDQLITNVDVVPTIADYAGIDRPAAWQRRSLRPVLESTEAEWHDYVVLDRQLFDLPADLWEQEDVAAEHPDVVDRLEQ